MVEFALVLPLWLMILALVFVTAWVCYLQINLERAVFEGAKVGAMFKENREDVAKQRTKEVMTAVELPDPQVTIDSAPFPQGRITVVATYEWSAPFAFGLPSVIPLYAKAVATLEP